MCEEKFRCVCRIYFFIDVNLLDLLLYKEKGDVMAGPTVAMGCIAKCMFGKAPIPLGILPTAMSMGDAMPIANIMSTIPFVDIPPFILCTSPKNPAAAAAMALGAPGGPCIPGVASWIPTTPNVMYGEIPALTMDSMGVCALGGGMIQLLLGEFNIMSI